MTRWPRLSWLARLPHRPPRNVLYRVYFNAWTDWPQCWSVDSGTQATETIVSGFEITGCRVRSHAIKTVSSDDTERTPRAWLSVEGQMRIVNGVALFTS